MLYFMAQLILTGKSKYYGSCILSFLSKYAFFTLPSLADLAIESRVYIFNQGWVIVVTSSDSAWINLYLSANALVQRL